MPARLVDSPGFLLQKKNHSQKKNPPKLLHLVEQVLSRDVPPFALLGGELGDRLSPLSNLVGLLAEENIDQHGAELLGRPTRLRRPASPAADAQHLGPVRKVVAVSPAGKHDLRNPRPTNPDQALAICFKHRRP
jgi:hypothetical protein